MAININPSRRPSKPAAAAANKDKFIKASSAENYFLGESSPCTDLKMENTFCQVDEMTSSISNHLIETTSTNEEFLSSMEPHVDKEEKNRSICSDLWARRHYVEWRKEQGLPPCQIEELSLTEVADSLVSFFYMVKKRNGSLFPSESLRAMFRAFGRILRSHYKKLQLEGLYDGSIVDISRDPLFEKARLACLEAMKYSKMHGGNIKRRKKPDEWVPAPEEDILCHPANQVTDPYGLLKRLCFYIIHKFHVYGHMELYYTTDVEFRRFINGDGTASWEYNEKRAANYKRKSTFRDAVLCSESDVVLCLDKYFFHAPPKSSQEEPRQLFLAPISKPTSNIWYRDQIMNLKTLRGWYRYMGPMPCMADSDPQLSGVSQMEMMYNDMEIGGNCADAYLSTPREFNLFDRCDQEEGYDGFDADFTDNELEAL